ncbi:MAG: secondary thiamine-phosphate synthase enzyme YjbQ [Bacillota bacterium]
MAPVATLELKSERRVQFITITEKVQGLVSGLGIREGAATVFVPHTTAGVTINENADPTVVRDIVAALERLVPENGDYRHSEGNSDAHIKASMMGSSVTVFINGGNLLLGTWQGIFFCEFDGPRKRKVWVRIEGT